MPAFAAMAATVLLGLLAMFQVTLAAGAPFGLFAWGGQSRVLPLRLRIGSVVSIVIYALIAAVLLERAGLIRLVGAAGFVQVAAWVVFAYFALASS